MLDPSLELADLHIHVGAAVAPHILWSIAHDQGFKLPVQTYWEFRDLVTAKPETVSSLADYLAILHHWTEKIQSSPAAIERSVYEIIGKEFRSSGVSLIELRFNPMKRNLGGERDLGHIIHAALRGMDRACLEYGVRAGLIFCLAREFPLELNEILVKKAVKYKSRGVVGIDLAGPESHTLQLGAEVAGYRDLFPPARAAALVTAGRAAAVAASITALGLLAPAPGARAASNPFGWAPSGAPVVERGRSAASRFRLLALQEVTVEVDDAFAAANRQALALAEQ